MPSFTKKKDLDSKDNEINQKDRSPPVRSNRSSSSRSTRAVFTSTKQSMDYITVSGIAQRINVSPDKFPEFCLKELLDNAVEFLEANYMNGSDRRLVEVHVKLDMITLKGQTDQHGQHQQHQQQHQLQYILQIVVRNSNDNNLVPFPNLPAIFNYDIFYSSKRYQHRISRGALGDALKEILAIPYALISSTETGDSFVRKQWPLPLIIRFNGEEYGIYLNVNKIADDTSPISTKIEGPSKPTNGSGGTNYIEVEVSLPILTTAVQRIDPVYKLEQYFQKYILFRSNRIEFSFNKKNE